jgi:hypothetical protein
MALAQRASDFEFPVASEGNNAKHLRRLTLSEAPSASEAILSRGMAVSACSALHDVAHAFRRAHRTTEDDVGAETDRYRIAVGSYPVGCAPLHLRQPIEQVSSPQGYAELRRKGRLLSPYPPLSDEALAKCSEQIRVALVCSTFPSGR